MQITSPGMPLLSVWVLRCSGAEAHQGFQAAQDGSHQGAALKGCRHNDRQAVIEDVVQGWRLFMSCQDAAAGSAVLVADYRAHMQESP